MRTDCTHHSGPGPRDSVPWTPQNGLLVGSTGGAVQSRGRATTGKGGGRVPSGGHGAKRGLAGCGVPRCGFLWPRAFRRFGPGHPLRDRGFFFGLGDEPLPKRNRGVGPTDGGYGPTDGSYNPTYPPPPPPVWDKFFFLALGDVLPVVHRTLHPSSVDNHAP